VRHEGLDTIRVSATMIKSFASAALIPAFFLTLVSAQTTDDSSCGLNYTARYGTSGTRSLSIANGGAGQSGLIEAWALKFIDDSVANGTDPFYVRCDKHGYYMELNKQNQYRLTGIWEIQPNRLLFCRLATSILQSPITKWLKSRP
jgi:hypothetical protein